MVNACEKHWDYESYQNFGDLPCEINKTCDYCGVVQT